MYLNLYMKTLSCRDAGCDCDYIAKGETVEEVIKHAAQHGMKEHGKTQEDMTHLQVTLEQLFVSHNNSSFIFFYFRARMCSNPII
jgi:predicted small metal-binding protein